MLPFRPSINLGNEAAREEGELLFLWFPYLMNGLPCLGKGRNMFHAGVKEKEPKGLSTAILTYLSQEILKSNACYADYKVAILALNSPIKNDESIVTHEDSWTQYYEKMRSRELLNAIWPKMCFLRVKENETL